MEAYLGTPHGRLELLAVGEVIRRQEKKSTSSSSESTIREHFDVFDVDGSGSVDARELGGLLRELRIPVKNADELAEIMHEVDADGSGTIDFPEFERWFLSSRRKKKKSKVARALAGVGSMLEARRVIVACAHHDAEQHARLVFRQSRPLGTATAREVEVDAAAERRFARVRTVFGRPGCSKDDDYDKRGFRARRALFHPDLWPLPPPTPVVLPPAWMNAAAPRLSDPDDVAGSNKNATVRGFDPVAGARAAPRDITGFASMGSEVFQNSLSGALVALRRDVAMPDAKIIGAPAIEVVPEGRAAARVVFSWRPEMLPRPKRDVMIEAEFNGWRPRRLLASKSMTYDVAFDLAPGAYRYRFRVDGQLALDAAAPEAAAADANIVYVLAYHASFKTAAAAAGAGPELLRLDLSGSRARDDGAWALAAAARAGGGGGALVSLCLASNGISADGAGAIASALASGAAWALRTLDLSRNGLGADGGAALGAMLATRRDDAWRAAHPLARAGACRPAPVERLVLSGCSLGDDGAARVAAGLAGHDAIRVLNLDDNGIVDLGAAALATALSRNATLSLLSLAANRLVPRAARALAEPLRLSGSLRSLDLTANPTLGPEGAAALGDALARDEKNKAPSSSLSHLSLAKCGVGRDRAGISALARGVERNVALESLDLSENDLDEWAASELATVLARSRGRLVDLRLEGNPDIRPEWLWRDHHLATGGGRAKSESKSSLSSKKIEATTTTTTIPSIATSLELNRRAAAAADRQRSLPFEVVPPPDAETLKLEGEWTAAGWYSATDEISAKKARDEQAAKANEADRERAERDAVAAAGAAAAAAAFGLARRHPDGPRLATAVVAQLGADLETSSKNKIVPAADSSSDHSRVAALFKLVDADDSGTIDGEELRPLLARLGFAVSERRAREILGEIDKDGSGAVELEELVFWLKKQNKKRRRRPFFFLFFRRRRRRSHFKEDLDDDLELRRDAIRALEADARYEAESAARAAFRRRYPPRDECVCPICGRASIDRDAAAKHARKPSAHERWKRREAAALRRRATLDRARAVVAERARAREARVDAARFPVLVVYDGRVPNHVELQTYDVPDQAVGRPTGAINLRMAAVSCVGDGLVSGVGAEWLRVAWPPHAPGGGGARAAASSRRDSTTSTVWLRNRSRDFAKGRKPVLRPLKAGPSPYDEKNEQPPKKKQARRAAEIRDELDDAAYACSPRSLNAGTEIILWNRPRWYRTAPSLPLAVRLKGRAVPETRAAVVGELEWGDAVLVFGKSGDWLVGAFKDRDNVWFVEKSPRRLFLQPVVNTLELAMLAECAGSPHVVEKGAPRTSSPNNHGLFAATVPVALRAEAEAHDDAALLAVGHHNSF
ncbi:hypothetical protein CTAYLR_001897 [Chrysophaeum taylorii]|uniref:EF-hand domain-containing protein n=1 Tax=Chrysophaeum taylorii TaxID=2483200 RepID=A0AAD7UAA4_9STRA|nr:hypothetical protein CTAYLR_001897 [Chrysophaeum taylorii]